MTDFVRAFRDAYDLVPHALLGGLLVAAACGAAGCFLRWRRLVWAGFAIPEAATLGTAFALGHASLLISLGVGAASLPLLVNQTVMVVFATALAVAWLIPIGRPARHGGENAAALCFLAATTGAVLVVSQSPHGTEEVRALATGKTLLFLTAEDVALLAWTLPPLVVAALLWSGPMSAAAFDRDHARVAGHPVLRLEAGLAVGLMLLMALAAPRAGAPLLFANLTLPPFAAERLVARPAHVVAVSILIALLGSVLGATAAVEYDLPFSTASIAGILAMAGVAVLVAAAASVVGRLLRRHPSS